MTLFQAIILGLVEGITEFLPVSSTAHLIAAEKAMGITLPSVFFNTVIQLGALLAVIVYFREKIMSMASESFAYIARVLAGKGRDPLPVGLGVIFASLPVFFAGFFLKSVIGAVHESTLLISFMSIVVGIFLLIAQKRSLNSSQKQITSKNLFAMGLYQTLALIPGTSRSGIVIAGGLFERLSFAQALEYSFFMSIPALGGAGVYELLTMDAMPSDSLLAVALATLVSFLSAMVAIHTLLRWVRKLGFTPFVIYRIFFGIAILFI